MADLIQNFSALLEKTRIVDNFYVKFMKLSDNVSNVLGRQVKGITRPDVSFEVVDTKMRGYAYTEKGYVRFSSVTIEFFDDENSVISSLLYAQVFRQLNKHKDLMNVLPADMIPSERDYRFDIDVQLFNSLNAETERYILKNCFISRLSHQQPEMTADDQTIITVEVSFNNIEYKIMDQFVSMLEASAS
jgi:hypothetical protein